MLNNFQVKSINKNDLNIHISQENFEVIGKKRKSKNNSLLSQMKSGNDKFYYCPKCSKKFTKISAVYRHANNFHFFPNGRPCLSCGKNIKNFYKHKKYCKPSDDLKSKKKKYLWGVIKLIKI